MYIYFYLFISLILFYYSQIYLVIYNKYKQYKQINTVMNTVGISKRKVAVQFYNIMKTYICLKFFQYINKSVKRIGARSYELTYILDGKLYKLIIDPPLNMNPVIQVSTDEYDDVTDLIIPYMGPHYDWHGYVFCPRFFGHKSLTFELSDGNSLTFHNNEDIKIET